MKFTKVFGLMFFARVIVSASGVVKASEECSNELCANGIALDGYPFGHRRVVTMPTGHVCRAGIA
jgi:hypothetical protein